ncbi:hypothetical protein [Helicobacter pylori]|nr:hypothetical protein [Helicobacter pylori]
MFKANALKTKKYDKIAFKSVYWQLNKKVALVLKGLLKNEKSD